MCEETQDIKNSSMFWKIYRNEKTRIVRNESGFENIY